MLECLNKSAYTHLQVFHSLHSLCTLLITLCSEQQKPQNVSLGGHLGSPTHLVLHLWEQILCLKIDAFWKGSTFLFSHFNLMLITISVPFLRADFYGGGGEGRRMEEGERPCEGTRTAVYSVPPVPPGPSSDCPVAIPVASPNPDSNSH